MKTQKDGLIKIDTLFAKELGFTSDKFHRDSYLWKTGNRITISFIYSKQEGKGNFSALLKAIESRGYNIIVPNPLARMRVILFKKGFKMTVLESHGEAFEAAIKEKA